MTSLSIRPASKRHLAPRVRYSKNVGAGGLVLVRPVFDPWHR